MRGSEIRKTERLLQVRNENVVEIHADRPKKEEAGNEDKGHDEASFRDRRRWIHHARPLCECPVEMHIAAIHEQMLAGNV